MKIVCGHKELVEAVLNIQRAASSKSSILVLEGILSQTKGPDLFLCDYDLELSMMTTLPAQVEQAGSVVPSARLFGDIVRRLPGDDASSLADEKNVVSVVSGASESSIADIPAEEYPELPSVSSETSIKVSNGILKSMIRQTLLTVSGSDMKPAHTGTLFRLNENQTRLISTDGYRLAAREELVAYDWNINFIVPGKTLSEVLRLLPEDEKNLVLSIGRRYILFQADSCMPISHLPEGEPLDYRVAIPASYTTEILVRTRTLIDSMKHVSLPIIDRLRNPLRRVFDENRIQLSCSMVIGRASDELEVQSTDGTLEVGSNSRYLLDALRNVECDGIEIQLSGAFSPMKVVPKDDNSSLFLVLLVRLKSGV